MSARAIRSIRTMSWLPSNTARCKGATPLLSLSLASLRALSRRRETSERPDRTAAFKGVPGALHVGGPSQDFSTCSTCCSADRCSAPLVFLSSSGFMTSNRSRQPGRTIRGGRVRCGVYGRVLRILSFVSQNSGSLLDNTWFEHEIDRSGAKLTPPKFALLNPSTHMLPSTSTHRIATPPTVHHVQDTPTCTTAHLHAPTYTHTPKQNRTRPHEVEQDTRRHTHSRTATNFPHEPFTKRNTNPHKTKESTQTH